ncbi:uncharacterized protein LOC134435089 isoform X2 [Engraulis encrasicolus]|uniref:uncharacterized protein LOC134435089 isoform X2 n=1 Tax=Engraulis encrasicolus TaxID=184585 RepID=UPI002FD67DE9
MPCCAGWTSMSYWSMEGGIHCSACPDSAGGKAPGFRLGRCVVRLLGSTASSGSGAGTVGRRVFRPSAVSGQGSCKDIETGWMIPVGRGAGAVPSLRTPGLRGPTGQRIGLWIPRKALKDPVDTRTVDSKEGSQGPSGHKDCGYQGRLSRTQWTEGHPRRPRGEVETVDSKEGTPGPASKESKGRHSRTQWTEVSELSDPLMLSC